MKKTVFSVILFLTLFGFVFFSHNLLMKVCKTEFNYCNTIENCINKIDKDDKSSPEWDIANKTASELMTYVEKYYGILSVYISHENLDLLDTETSRLVEYIKEKDKVESLVSISTIESHIKNIKSLQEVRIKNIM